MDRTRYKPIVLIVMDGIGAAVDSQGNAVTKANPPFLTKLWEQYPHTFLQASGEYVGLPHGIRGNSEVGHTALGAGRIVYQELPRIDRAIQNGSFFTNSVLLKAFEHVNQRKSKLHVALCFSDAGTHATTKHLESLILMAKKLGFKERFIIHAFTDGRDSPPKSAETYFKQIETKLIDLPNAKFGSVTGRYFAMDRNESWDRIEKAYNMLTSGTGRTAASWKDVLDQAYKANETDEFILPTIIKTDDKTTGLPTVDDNDAFIFLNFRADRAIELTSALMQPDLGRFKQAKVLRDFYFVGMTEYARGYPQNIAFPKEDIKLPLGRVIAEEGLRQLRIAEFEKFPHVTYFFNGGRSIKFNGEDRIEIPSPKVATYDLKPEMSLPEVTQILLSKLELRIYDFILLNIANGDMVGHTGVFDAGIKAITAVDSAIHQISQSVLSIGGALVITADHGNIEEMINTTTGDIDTEHSLNPVPFVLVEPSGVQRPHTLPSGALGDVTPTILKLMGINQPSEMTGNSLIE